MADYKSFILLAFSVLTLTSCKINLFLIDKIELFKADNLIRLFSVYKAVILSPDLVNIEQPIVRPVSTWQPLVKLYSMAANAKKERIYCLFYKIPQETIGLLGTIKITEITMPDNCTVPLDNNLVSSLDDIIDLSIYLDDKISYLKNNRKILPFELNLHFMRDGQHHQMVFPLMNLEGHLMLVKKGDKIVKTSRQLNEPPKRYRSSITERIESGVIFWQFEDKISNQRGNQHQTTIEHLGKLQHSYAEQTAITCHQVDFSCKTKKEYQCDKCRFGWFEVAGSDCPQGATKICGPNRCGQKEWPACWRGSQFEHSEADQSCYDGSSLGFCQTGLHPFCKEDVLICL